MVRHVLTFDVEHWYDSPLLAGARLGTVDPGWAEEETLRLVDLLARHGTRATFFVLGALAAERPHLVPRLAAAGHEVACHGWTHVRLHELDQTAFRSVTTRAKALLEDQAGRAVVGYRASTWSHGVSTPWVGDVLEELGFVYDSSVFPWSAPLYGVAKAPRRPYRLATSGQGLLELPPFVHDLGGLSVPMAGGIYWRVLPALLVCRALAEAEEPAVLYAHPWEIEPANWRVPRSVALPVRLSIAAGRGHLHRVLDAVLGNFLYTTLAERAAELSSLPLPRYAWRDQGLEPLPEMVLAT